MQSYLPCFRIRWALALLICSTVVFMSNRTGVPQAVTLAPGEASGLSCNACHVKDKEYNPTVDLVVMNLDSSPVTAYEPAKKYILKLKVNGTNGVKSYGFQMVSLVGPENKDAGLWSNLGAKVKSITLQGRKYLEQSNTQDNGLFYTHWTAPASGEVKFYMAGLAINGNGNTSGDQVVNNVKTLPQFGVSSTSDLQVNKFIWYDNQSQSIVVTADNDISQLKVFNGNGNHLTSVDINNLSLSSQIAGVYYVMAFDRKGNQKGKTMKVVKI
jgi:hypothetical protein